MSATQTAVFITAAALAAGLGLVAMWLVWRNRNNHDHYPVGFAATGLGLLAVLLFGVGACTANGDKPGPPEPTSRCAAGTYDQTPTDDAHCVPYPSEGGR